MYPYRSAAAACIFLSGEASERALTRPKRPPLNSVLELTCCLPTFFQKHTVQPWLHLPAAAAARSTPASSRLRSPSSSSSFSCRLTRSGRRCTTPSPRATTIIGTTPCAPSHSLGCCCRSTRWPPFSSSSPQVCWCTPPLTASLKSSGLPSSAASGCSRWARRCSFARFSLASSTPASHRGSTGGAPPDV